MQTKIAENIRFIESRVNAAKGVVPTKQQGLMLDSDTVLSGSIEKRYWIAEDSRTPINLSQLLQTRTEDPAFRVSLDA